MFTYNAILFFLFSGRLKKLSILKLDKNSLVTITPAIGSCVSLQELFLTENLLTVCVIFIVC